MYLRRLTTRRTSPRRALDQLHGNGDDRLHGGLRLLQPRDQQLRGLLPHRFALLANGGQLGPQRLGQGDAVVSGQGNVLGNAQLLFPDGFLGAEIGGIVGQQYVYSVYTTN